MAERFSLRAAAPDLYAAMAALDRAAAQAVKASLPASLLEPVKMRASQLNGWNRIAISTRLEPGHYRSPLKPEGAANR